jgi:hypothetical protein
VSRHLLRALHERRGRYNARMNMLIGQTEAGELVRNTTDPVTQNLLKVCTAAVTMRLMRRADESEADWAQRQPQAPFDAAFFVSVMSGVMSRHDMLKRILAGETIAQATGWDV